MCVLISFFILIYKIFFKVESYYVLLYKKINLGFFCFWKFKLYKIRDVVEGFFDLWVIYL